MAAVNLDLPPIDGEAELGIAVGIDSGLANNQKLVVCTGVPRNARAVLAATWALRNMANEFGADAERRSFVINAAIAIVTFQMLPADLQDGDVVPRDGAVADDDAALPNPGEAQIIRDAYSMENVNKAASMIAATKVNWWQINHHTGQGPMQGYTFKTFNIKYPGRDEQLWRTVIHRAGHWASTKTILTGLGWERIQVGAPLPDCKPIRGSADLVLRRGSTPAGVAPYSVCHAAFKKIATSPIVAIFPGIADAVRLDDLMRKVRLRPERYHMGSAYLTGMPRVEPPADLCMIGRCGSFCKVFMPSSTLMRSPTFQEARITSAEDYDPAFYQQLQAVRTAGATPANVHQALTAAAVPNAAGTYDAICAYTVTLPPAVAAAAELLTPGAQHGQAFATALNNRNATVAALPNAFLAQIGENQAAQGAVPPVPAVAPNAEQ